MIITVYVLQRKCVKGGNAQTIGQISWKHWELQYLVENANRVYVYLYALER